MPIFAMCENLLPAAFDDIGAAVLLMPDPEVTMTMGFWWPSRKLRNFLFSRRRSRWGVVIRVVRGGFLSISFVSRCNVALFVGCFSDFLLTLQGECALSFSSWTLFRVCVFFSNNQHFSVFYITLWNCFTDLVPFSSLFSRTSVVCIYVYNRFVDFSGLIVDANYPKDAALTVTRFP